eukprot:jgi/Undpi1/13233/HiC_scaffold_8.g02895.m1
MRSFSLSVALLGSIMVCKSSAFATPLAGSTIHRLSQASASARGRCRQRLAAYSEPTMGFKSPLDVLKQGIARAGAGPYDKEAVQKTVSDYTSGSKVVVFSWTKCPFCKKVKGLVEDLVEDQSQYEFVELDKRDDGNAIRYELSQMTGRTSVPQIWIGGEYVGGCNDGPGIFTLMDKGELSPMLEEAGCTLKAL